MGKTLTQCSVCRQIYDLETLEGHAKDCPFYGKDDNEVEIL